MICLSNIHKAYGSITVFQSFSLSITESDKIAIIGPSGCGKTTLLRLLSGLEKPDSGTITGVPDCISFVFQEDRLCPSMTAVENVRLVLPRSTPINIITHALCEVGLSAQLHVPVSTLSGGMKRRVAIVRAMLAPCSLFLLDEPYKGLDDSTKMDVMSFVERHRNNRTMIFVTHDTEEAIRLNAKIITLQKNGA